MATPTPAEPAEIRADGTTRPIVREWVPEAPVALEFNGLSYAVMMATPRDLEDFTLGFALTEGLAQAPSDLSDIAVAEVEAGWIVRAQLAGIGIEQLTDRVRARVEGGRGEVLRYAPDEADLLATERKVKALWQAIERALDTGEWRARRSRLCDWCDHQALCPEFGGTPPPVPDRQPGDTVRGSRRAATDEL